MSRAPTTRLIAAAAALLFFLAACGNEGVTEGSNQGAGSQDVEFTDGTIPESLPSDFPLPAQGVIGTGMINRTSGQTELIVRVPAPVPAVVEFFESNFEARGYEVTASEAEGAEGWTMSYEKDDISGTLDLSLVGEQITQVVLRAAR